MVRLLEGLPSDSFSVTVVALQGGSQTVVQDLPEHVEVVDLDISNKLHIHRLAPLVAISKRTDILIGSIYHSEIISRLIGVTTGVDTLLNWAHSTGFQSRIRRVLDLLTIDLCDAILADSEAVATMVIEQQGVDSEIVWTVPIAGLSMEAYNRPPTPFQALDVSVIGGTPLERVSHDATVVGTVGTLTPAKNHDAILDLAERMSESDVHFAIAGDGPRRQELVDSISDRNLPNVSLIGELNVEVVPSFLSTVDIYFQPSYREGLCITVIEAMAAGKPIVASDAGEIPNNVEHGKHGFVTNATDISGFESYVRRLMEDMTLRNDLGNASREQVREEYSQEALVETFQEVVEQTYYS